MKKYRLIITLLTLLSVNNIFAQFNNLKEVQGYAGVSPIPQIMKQGKVAFPVPKYVSVKKGIVSDKSFKNYQNIVPQQAEGYYLRFNKKGAILVGRDSVGLFYAEQTLNQLLLHDGFRYETEIIDWPSITCRGVIEGFYGNPWSHKDRLRQFDFYGKNKLNTYVYGPKDDPYHRNYWRDPYPEKEASMLKELIVAAKNNHVKFVWAIHPGIDIQWNKSDSIAIVKKLESVYQLGARSFAVFFDDISGEGTKADKQAGLMNYISDSFVKEHSDVEPMIICPTQYNKAWSHGDYLHTLGTLMYPEIRIMWTGNSVVDMIEQDDMKWINNQIGRKAFIWLNYPVNDYCQSRILMGKTYGNGNNIEDMVSGFCSNPMEYAEASKVSLYSIADYTWNISAYDATKSWERAMSALMPTSSDVFKIFCENNVDLGVTGHGLRREGESVKFQPYLQKIQQFEYSSDEGVSSEKAYAETKQLCNSMDLTQLKKEFNQLIWAANVLLKDSVKQPEMLGEIKPWVLSMQCAGIRGVQLVEAAQALLNKQDEAFIQAYLNYKDYEEKQKNLRSRDFEGSIVKAQPAFSGDVITPLLKQLADALITLYKKQYNKHWDVFPSGIIADGNYYILYDDKMLTDSLASATRTGDYPVFLAEKDVINPQRQLWHISFNLKTEAYNITNVQDGRYLNELGLFWRDMQQNPFDSQYHSFSIQKSDGYYSIQQTGKGGKNYWNCDGRRITTGKSDNNFIFKIVSPEELGK